MSPKLEKKLIQFFDFLKDNVMVCVCRALRNPKKPSTNRVNMISNKMKMSCSIKAGNITM